MLWAIAWKLGYPHPDLMLKEVSVSQLKEMYAYYMVDSGAYANRKRQEQEANQKTQNLRNFLNSRASNGD